MGRATKWLKTLFGINKNSDQTDHFNSGHRRDKNGIFGRDYSTGLCHNPATIPPNITPAEASWLSSIYNDTEQTKHAIAVAAATSVAADAAVAAAKAAIAVVKLTSKGKDATYGRGGERWAAVKIQTTFRGYLSRKALKALKGLVKVQALVRGYLVRKQAMATLHSMQALIRAQTTIVRARKLHPQLQSPKSNEKFDEARNEKNSTSVHSRRLSSLSFEKLITNPLNEPPKIVQVDSGTNNPKSRRTNSWVCDVRDSSGGYYLSHRSIPTHRNPLESNQDLGGDKCRCCCTGQNTPRTANSCGSPAPLTPARSVCVDNFFRQYTNDPNYMTSTQSFKAKLRSQSAPRQRTETGHVRKLSLTEMMDSRRSMSGVKMQSCSQINQVINLKSLVMGNMNRSSDFC